PPPPPQWVLDLNSKPSPSQRPPAGIPDPPGYSSPSVKMPSSQKSKSHQAAKPPPTEADTSHLKLKKAWELALGPAKQIPMNAIGMYMTGNSLQIFSIMMVLMLFKNPLTAILSVQSHFARFETDSNRSQMLGVKAVYVLMNLGLLGLGLYKVNKMGLLPTTRSDWLLWEAQRDVAERGVP
ncbi:hypothetical protein BDY21DRAFT_273520, partial [Lineolata rhizophorae]